MKKNLRTITIMKQKKEMKKSNHQNAAKTRRQRGYQWEDTIVKRFKKTENWKAFRLGSPSVALPDVLAVNTEKSAIFTIEAKSGTSTTLPVPADQIERCLEWIKTFDIYKDKAYVNLAGIDLINQLMSFSPSYFYDKYKHISKEICEKLEIEETPSLWIGLKDGEKVPLINEWLKYENRNKRIL